MTPRIADLGHMPALTAGYRPFSPEQPKPTADQPFPSRPGPSADGYIDVTPANLGLDDDLVAHALHALSQFGANNLREAKVLLSMWARRDQLTDEQVAAVLGYYRPQAVA